MKKILIALLLSGCMAVEPLAPAGSDFVEVHRESLFTGSNIITVYENDTMRVTNRGPDADSKTTEDWQELSAGTYARIRGYVDHDMPLVEQRPLAQVNFEDCPSDIGAQIVRAAPPVTGGRDEIRFQCGDEAVLDLINAILVELLL